MLKNIFAFILLLIAASPLSAQTTKADVLVIGNTASGISAGIQAARSGVKTILIIDNNALSPALTNDDFSYLESIQNHYTYKSNKKTALKDSLISRNISLAESSRLIKSITDTVKNLTVMLNRTVNKIERSGKGWDIKLNQGKAIKTKVVVDATDNLTAITLLNLKVDNTIVALDSINVLNQFSNKLYRTSVGIGRFTNSNNATMLYLIPIATLLPKNSTNLVIIPKTNEKLKPFAMSVGQAAGATAAYCAFYKTTTKDLNIRAIQVELFGYESLLIPFSDIKTKDPQAMAFQHTVLAGLLKPKTIKNGSNYEMQFDTSGIVTSKEIREPMREFYTRSQIWFADNKSDTLTIEKTISLIMFVGSRGTELKSEIEKGWKKSFKFATAFDLKRPITRREFAALAEAYLQPFNSKVDLTGRLLN